MASLSPFTIAIEHNLTRRMMCVMLSAPTHIQMEEFVHGVGILGAILEFFLLQRFKIWQQLPQGSKLKGNPQAKCQYSHWLSPLECFPNCGTRNMELKQDLADWLEETISWLLEQLGFVRGSRSRALKRYATSRNLRNFLLNPWLIPNLQGTVKQRTSGE